MTPRRHHPITPSPHHPITPSPRVAVIGAGIVGAAVAQRLAEKGIATLLLDAAEPGSGATGASLGAVTAREQRPRAFYDLCVAAMAEYRRLAWKLAPAPWYHADGSLAWGNDPAGVVALREQVRRLQAWGYAAELLPAREVVAGLAPGLDIADPETPVAWFADEAWVEPRAMTKRLVDGVRNAGGRVLTGPEREVVAIGVEQGRVAAVTLRGGQTIPVRAVVNAAGVDSGRVAALVGRHLPVEVPRSLALRLEMPDGGDPLRRPVRADRVFMRPDGPGHVMLVPQIDVGETPPGPLALNDPRVSESKAWAAAAVPALAVARAVAAHVAPWPLIADGLPCVGGVAEIPGYFEAVTDYGITLAPLIARSLAEEVVGAPGDPLLAPFGPERFAAA